MNYKYISAKESQPSQEGVYHLMLGSEHKVTAFFLFPDRVYEYSNDYTYPIWFNNQTFYFEGIEYPLSQIEWLCGVVEKENIKMTPELFKEVVEYLNLTNKQISNIKILLIDGDEENRNHMLFSFGILYNEMKKQNQELMKKIKNSFKYFESTKDSIRDIKKFSDGCEEDKEFNEKCITNN